MADNKKSFILYCDLIHTVEHLTDEQAGHLFKHILEYVNDLNPQTDNVITKLSFEPIKQQLKRDLKKWEEKTGQRSEAGLNSALSKFRTKLDLSTKLEIENIKKDIESRLSNDKENEYLQQALIICNERLTKSTTVKSRSTKSTVNVTVNDTVTVNDNDNDTVIKEEIKENIKQEILNSDSWIESIGMKKKIPTIKTFLIKFLDEQELLEGEGNGLNRNINDIKNHFVHWIDKQPKDSSKAIIGKDGKKSWSINSY